MSFFDEDDEPRRTPRPRRARPAGGGVATADSQTLLIRRAVALVGGILVLLLLLFFVNSCRDRQRENALKDYNRQLSTIATDSSEQVGKPFFALLEEGEAMEKSLTILGVANPLQPELLARYRTEYYVPSDLTAVGPDILALAQLALQFVDLTVPTDALFHSPALRTAPGKLAFDGTDGLFVAGSYGLTVFRTRPQAARPAYPLYFPSALREPRER